MSVFHYYLALFEAHVPRLYKCMFLDVFRTSFEGGEHPPKGFSPLLFRTTQDYDFCIFCFGIEDILNNQLARGFLYLL